MDEAKPLGFKCVRITSFTSTQSMRVQTIFWWALTRFQVINNKMPISNRTKSIVDMWTCIRSILKSSLAECVWCSLMFRTHISTHQMQSCAHRLKPFKLPAEKNWKKTKKTAFHWWLRHSRCGWLLRWWKWTREGGAQMDSFLPRRQSTISFLSWPVVSVSTSVCVRVRLFIFIYHKFQFYFVSLFLFCVVFFFFSFTFCLWATLLLWHSFCLRSDVEQTEDDESNGASIIHKKKERFYSSIFATYRFVSSVPFRIASGRFVSVFRSFCFIFCSFRRRCCFAFFLFAIFIAAKCLFIIKTK